jgi:glycosyltransferase involved in cell wall biosynthesis
MENKFCVIISLSSPWLNHPRKYFFKAIAQTIRSYGGYILCLEPTVISIHTLFLYPERVLDWMKGKYGFRTEDDNVFVVPAKTVEHLLLSVRFKPLMWLNKKILRRQLQNALNKIDKGISDIIWMVHRPELHYLIGILNEKGVIYDCCDDYNLTSKMNRLKVMGNQEREKILAKRSTFVIASAEGLCKRNLEYNPKSYLIENGFSKEIFSNGYRQPRDENVLASLPRPIIGYIGRLRHWLDFELLDYVVANRPEWTFLFAGEVSKDCRKRFSLLLRNHKNIYSTCWIPYNDFPGYLRHFDIGIIPFNTNEFMQTANPNKLYDYMVAGLPVVSTNIGDLKKKYADFVKVADSKKEFISHIESFLNMPASEKAKLKCRILKRAAGHSWEDSASVLYGLIKEHILK